MITLQDIRPDFNITVQKNMFVGILNDFHGHQHRYGYVIDYDVHLPNKKLNLQRPFCWNIDQKRELILSILKDTHIPPVTVIRHQTKNKDVIFKIIDGKQRLSTMIDFIDDKFTLLLFGKEYYFSELPEELKNVIRMYNIYFDQSYEDHDDLISEEDIIEWFNRINFAGTPQDREHIEKLNSAK